MHTFKRTACNLVVLSHLINPLHEGLAYVTTAMRVACVISHNSVFRVLKSCGLQYKSLCEVKCPSRVNHRDMDKLHLYTS